MLFHGLSAWIYAPQAGISRLEALFLHRPLPFRQLAGGQHRRLIAATGEYERLVRSIGLHADALHLGVNAMSIVVVGALLEPLIGPVRLVSSFVACGVAASLASYFFGPLVSDGASGGAFGLLGLLAVIAWRRRATLDEHDRVVLTRWIPAFILLNLVLSVVLPFVDLVAHVAGLLAGMLVGLLPTSGRNGQILEALFVAIVLLYGLLGGLFHPG